MSACFVRTKQNECMSVARDPNPPLSVRRGVLEMSLVLACSLGASAVYAILQLAELYTAREPVSEQTQSLHNQLSPTFFFDISYQVLEIAFSLAPIALAVYLLGINHAHPLRIIGLDRRRPVLTWLGGAGLAALIGIPGISVYVLGRTLGLTPHIEANGLGMSAATVIVLVLAALRSGLQEEVLMIGYLYTRMREIGWPVWVPLVVSSLIRGCYHLYQGVGMGIGNAVMGLVFGLFFLRTRRVAPLVVAHVILDLVSFLGYDAARALFPHLF